MGDDDVSLLVPDHELELRMLRAQEVPVFPGHLSVTEERREGVLDLARAGGEIRSLRVRERTHGGAQSIVGRNVASPRSGGAP